MELGALVASILMFLPVTNVPTLTSDTYYWLVFLCVVLAVPLILLAFTQKASILSCVVVGTYTVLVPVDYYIGTNLRFLSLNVIRRAIHGEEFRAAIINPPFTTSDLTLVA